MTFFSFGGGGGGIFVFRFTDINHFLVHKCVEFIMRWREDTFSMCYTLEK